MPLSRKVYGRSSLENRSWNSFNVLEIQVSGRPQLKQNRKSTLGKKVGIDRISIKAPYAAR